MAGEARTWALILALAAGTFLIRLSFLGLIGARGLPRWAMRMLAFTPVAVLPALIAPATVWPAATGGHPEPVRLAAALATLVAGLVWRSAPRAMAVGAVALALGLWLAP